VARFKLLGFARAPLISPVRFSTRRHAPLRPRRVPLCDPFAIDRPAGKIDPGQRVPGAEAAPESDGLIAETVETADD